MGTEIERKYLVKGTEMLADCAGRAIVQGYLCVGPPLAVRVRIDGDRAILNIKQATTTIERAEFEYDIPLADGEAILAGIDPAQRIEKRRYEIPWEGLVWEVDVFEGANAGLVVAEVELDAADQAVALPPWVGAEVSGDPRYLNTHLSRCPYSTW